MLLLAFIPSLVGFAALWAMGEEPSWRRVVTVSLLGFVIGLAVDVAFPLVAQIPLPEVRHFVVVPLIGPYGVSVYCLTVLPVGIIAAAENARRTVKRLRPANDLRN
jgi:hypothetical protein